jgi:hypothetical protein
MLGIFKAVRPALRLLLHPYVGFVARACRVHRIFAYMTVKHMRVCVRVCERALARARSWYRGLWLEIDYAVIHAHLLDKVAHSHEVS